jgi:hypothetical protein
MTSPLPVGYLSTRLQRQVHHAHDQSDQVPPQRLLAMVRAVKQRAAFLKARPPILQ